MVDQSPIGKTTRSNPASYVGAFDAITKAIFADSIEAKQRKYTPGTFSFNSGNGRCPACGGNGFEHVEMQFLSDVYLRCPDCDGKRFRAEILEVKVGGKSIADVLELTVSEALYFFRNEADAGGAAAAAQGRRPGLPAPRPAGADALRRRGAAPEARRPPRRGRRHRKRSKLFLFDEPTTGLHFDDVAKLLRAFRQLLDAGPLAAGHRAQPRRDPRLRLDHRPRPRGRRGRRRRRLHGHARGSDASMRPRTPAKALRDYELSFLKDLSEEKAKDMPGRYLGNAIQIHKAREHNLKNIDVEIPRNRFTRGHRRLGLGQIHARLRHPVLRGPAALPRVAQRLRAPVRAGRGAPGRGRDLRHSADGGDRAAHQPRRPQEHRRHAHRGAPLPAPRLREARHPVLPGLRSADRAAERRIDCGQDFARNTEIRPSPCSRR